MAMLNAPASMVLTTLLQEPLQVDNIGSGQSEEGEHTANPLGQPAVPLTAMQHPQKWKTLFRFGFGT
jgi:hypothetical protein